MHHMTIALGRAPAARDGFDVSMTGSSATVSVFGGPGSGLPCLFPTAYLALGGWLTGTNLREPRGTATGIASSYLEGCNFSPQR